MQPQPENALVPHVDRAQMGTIFRVLTEKQDTDTQILPREIVVSLKDVFALELSVKNQLENYREISAVNSATVEFSNNRSKQFSSISALKNFNWERPETTASITLRWNLLLDIPSADKPAEHCIVVRIACGLKPQDVFRAAFSKQLEDLDSWEISAGGCTCHVTFANQALASDIFRVVSDWSESRPTPEYLVPYLKSLRNHSELIAKCIARSIPTSTVLALLAYYCTHTRGLDQEVPANVGFIRFTLLFGSLMWLASVVTSIFGRWLANHSITLLHRIGNVHPFVFTAGDNKKQEELNAKTSKSAKRFFIEGGVSVVWNIVATVVIWLFTKK